MSSQAFWVLAEAMLMRWTTTLYVSDFRVKCCLSNLQDHDVGQMLRPQKRAYRATDLRVVRHHDSRVNTRRHINR